MSSQRPPIPSSIKREVRQRCGFGCVICGCPIYDYDHLYGYNDEQGHIVDEITLLCPTHHREKTNGLITLDMVERANENPFNLRKGVSTPYGLRLTGTQAITIIGNNRFYHPLNLPFFWPLVIKDEVLIGYHIVDGQLFLTLKIYDKNNSLLFWVLDNELQYKTGLWDVNFVGSTLSIRERPRKYIIQISFNSPHTIVIERGRFIYDGLEVNMKLDKVILPGNISLTGCTFFQCIGGIGIDPQWPVAFKLNT